MTNSGDIVPHQPQSSDEHSKYIPAPLEVGMRRGALELTLTTGQLNTETVADALHTMAEHYHDMLNGDNSDVEENLSALEVGRLGRNVLTATELATRLRGHDEPFDPAATQAKRMEGKTDEGSRLSRLGRAIIGPATPKIENGATTPVHRPTPKPVVLRGAEVNFVFECLERAPAILDEQAAKLATSQPPQPNPAAPPARRLEAEAEVAYVVSQLPHQVQAVRDRAANMRTLGQSTM